MCCSRSPSQSLPDINFYSLQSSRTCFSNKVINRYRWCLLSAQVLCSIIEDIIALNSFNLGQVKKPLCSSHSCFPFHSILNYKELVIAKHLFGSVPFTGGKGCFEMKCHHTSNWQQGVVAPVLTTELTNAYMLKRVWLHSSWPRGYSPPGFSVQGIFQERILEWVAIFYSRGSSWSGIKPTSPTGSCVFLTTWGVQSLIITRG